VGATVQHVTCWLTSGAFRSVNATLELAQSCAREPTTQSGSAAPHSLSRRQMKGRSMPRRLALVLAVLPRARRLKRRSTERCVLWCARSPMQACAANACEHVRRFLPNEFKLLATCTRSTCATRAVLAIAAPHHTARLRVLLLTYATAHWMTRW
jgi:hypothetical protein